MGCDGRGNEDGPKILRLDKAVPICRFVSREDFSFKILDGSIFCLGFFSGGNSVLRGRMDEMDFLET